ncbi:hypothetical protein K437DRAFT_296971 [Tilletiaria anomala UBC 951]|uniref:Uncharacterized protein n=1 Tax=Tilletiaria anomala (strain ATCC 24038 / CBS 436.72 / UBC 951) TaxID=1037660 RepID=A0A066V1E1_TILAU|nr:uncharacterized protein K437DRAFT_296971 [Tilletiaria anomala UBC 951]KDN35266.1 hypothetical protein K437DRAFT_296971 [Tilletiaria anomala UBC 951]
MGKRTPHSLMLSSKQQDLIIPIEPSRKILEAAGVVEGETRVGQERFLSLAMFLGSPKRLGSSSMKPSQISKKVLGVRGYLGVIKVGAGPVNCGAVQNRGRLSGLLYRGVGGSFLGAQQECRDGDVVGRSGGTVVLVTVASISMDTTCKETETRAKRGVRGLCRAQSERGARKPKSYVASAARLPSDLADVPCWRCSSGATENLSLSSR